MASFRSVFIALALAASGLLGASEASSDSMSPMPTAIPLSLNIVAFGSSSTKGIGASSPAASYPAQLQVALHRMMPQGRVTVLNRGIAGEDADDMMKRLKRDVIDRRPDLVIFQTGSNDPMRHVPLARFERETRDSVKAMQTAGITVILMEPQWCPTLDRIVAAAGYRDAIRKIGAEMNVDVIRRSDLMHDWVAKGILTQHDMLSADGLHMRDPGYALLARTVATEVLRTEALQAQARLNLMREASL